jgi:putative pyrroloquinoline-quinone binding quinoprotein
MRLRLLRFALGGIAACGAAVVGCGGDDTSMVDAALSDGSGSGSGGSSGSSSGAGGSGGDSGRDGTTDAKGDGPADGSSDQRAADQSASDATTTDASGDATTGDGSGTDGGTNTGVDSGGVTGASVLQEHKNATRDGFYLDTALSKAAIHTMHLDTAFSATTSGQTFSDPLFMEGGVNGQDALFVATEQSDVFALDPKTGAQLWTQNLGTAVSNGAGLLCAGGSVKPMGVSGTPIIDPASRTLYADAMIVAMTSSGMQPRHYIFSLSVDTGHVNWSIDVTSTISGFDATSHTQRPGLALVGGKLFVAYGGLDGDCDTYHGWVVGVPVNSPMSATAWSTAAPSGAGIWGPSGVASDGTSVFVATGNAHGQYPSVWTQTNSEAIVKLSTAPAFSGNATDYFTQMDWRNQDIADTDLGSSGLVLFDAPGSTPTHLAFAIGKTSTARLLDQTNLGGISNGISNLGSNGQVFGSLFAYTTSMATYVGAQTTFSGCTGGDFSVLKVSSTAQLSFAWCASSNGSGGQISSNTAAAGMDGIVWSFGAAGDGVLRAWDADTGASLAMPSVTAVGGSVQHWTSPIIAKGRIYVAGDGAVYAYTL